MLMPRGQVKVLDFGLAKIRRPESVDSKISTLVPTTPGMVLGTVPYMSPEQALGHEVDHRSDLFSLGVVLYEMATGRLPFAGSSTSEILDRILHSQPEAIARFNYDVPPELERIVRKCLEKDREGRYQSARDLLVDLRHLRRESDATARQGVNAEALTSNIDLSPRRTLLTLAALALSGMGVFYFVGRSSSLPKVTDYKRITNDALPKTGINMHRGSLVTDGSRVYFSEYRNGETVLAQAAATSGETVFIPTPFVMGARSSRWASSSVAS